LLIVFLWLEMIWIIASWIRVIICIKYLNINIEMSILIVILLLHFQSLTGFHLQNLSLSLCKYLRLFNEKFMKVYSSNKPLTIQSPISYALSFFNIRISLRGNWLDQGISIRSFQQNNLRNKIKIYPTTK